MWYTTRAGGGLTGGWPNAHHLLSRSQVAGKPGEGRSAHTDVKQIDNELCVADFVEGSRHVQCAKSGHISPVLGSEETVSKKAEVILSGVVLTVGKLGSREALVGSKVVDKLALDDLLK